jgi:hypothetical protein
MYKFQKIDKNKKNTYHGLRFSPNFLNRIFFNQKIQNRKKANYKSILLFFNLFYKDAVRTTKEQI